MIAIIRMPSEEAVPVRQLRWGQGSHYHTAYNFRQIGGSQRMILDTPAAEKLIAKFLEERGQ